MKPKLEFLYFSNKVEETVLDGGTEWLGAGS